MDEFRSLRGYEEEKIVAKAKWVLWPMRSWADDVVSPVRESSVPAGVRPDNKASKYSSAKAAEISARRRFASIYKDADLGKKDDKKAIARSQVFTDSKGRILGARESGEAGAYNR